MFALNAPSTYPIPLMKNTIPKSVPDLSYSSVIKGIIGPNPDINPPISITFIKYVIEHY
jgi:hypothetical protein